MRLILSLERFGCAAAVVSSLLLGQLTAARADCSEHVVAHFGWILNTPTTNVVIWPPARPDWPTYWLYWSTTLRDSTFYDRVAEYGVGPGTSGLVYTPDAPGGSSVSESTIRNVLISMLDGAHRIPPPGSLYLILLPQGVSTTEEDGTPVEEGYHGWVNHQFSDGVTRPIVYAVIVYNNDFQHTNVAISHEIYEAVTNPIYTSINGQYFGFGYWDDAKTPLDENGNQPEVADLCARLNPLFPIWQNQYGMSLSQVWSQQSCNCR